MLGVLPLARDEQLELHGPPSLLATPPLGELDERAADPGRALLERGHQHPELRRVAGDVADAHAPDHLTGPAGDRDLAGHDQIGELARRRPRRPVDPQPGLGDGVDVVDEIRERPDQPCIAAVRCVEQLDGEAGVQRAEQAIGQPRPAGPIRGSASGRRRPTPRAARAC